MNTNNVSFVKSAASPEGFIHDSRKKIVFAGRSNVGKSSIINSILNRKNFARVGSAPGKTTQVNYFLVDKAYFVDLPGYGYAKVSGKEKERWGQLMESFFAFPDNVSLGVLVIDCRHRPTADDEMMNSFFQSLDRPYVVVANKCDKLNKTEIRNCEAFIRESLALSESIKVILYSAQSGLGRPELLKIIEKNC